MSKFSDGDKSFLLALFNCSQEERWIYHLKALQDINNLFGIFSIVETRATKGKLFAQSDCLFILLIVPISVNE